MKLIEKFFIDFYVFLYRLTGGKFGGELGRFKVLILTTKGARSGKLRSHPLGYFERDGGYFIVASNAGKPRNPAWYYNIKANPGDLLAQINGKKMRVKPQIILGEPRKPLYAWIASLAPNYGAYEKQTTREIPLVFLKAQ